MERLRVCPNDSDVLAQVPFLRYRDVVYFIITNGSMNCITTLTQHVFKFT